MRTISFDDKQALDEIIRDAPQEEVLILRDGHAIALVIPFDDDDAEWYARESDPGFIESIRRAREQVEHGQVVSHEDLSREVGL